MQQQNGTSWNDLVPDGPYQSLTFANDAKSHTHVTTKKKVSSTCSTA